MPRTIRTHAPGAGVHITARTQGGVKLFENIRDDISVLIGEGARSYGHKLLALVVMPNHFHMIVKQGPSPLGWMMQRIMQRTASRVQRRYGTEGHVFGRRYWSCVCNGADYLRQAIVYTHLNPCASNLCTNASDYAWSSHNLLVGRPVDNTWSSSVAIEETRLLFAHESLSATSTANNYQRFVSYALKRRAEAVPGDRFLFARRTPELPRAKLGDLHWGATYSHVLLRDRPNVIQSDVRDRAIAILRRLAPDCDLGTIQLAGRQKQLSRIRRELVAALSTSGFRGANIARCLRISPSVVTRVISELNLRR